MSVRTLRYNTIEQHFTKGITASTDRDALAFLEAAQIYNTNQQKAIVQLVRRLKQTGLWSKMKAIYPFVGGTATSHKWNLKDPQDTDAAFRLSFSGGWTHSSTGATPNGTNAYADTFWNTQMNGDKDSGHLSYYSRTNNTANNIEIGSYTPGANASYTYILQYTASIFVRDYRWCEGGTVTRVNNPATTTGYLIANRNSSTVGIGYRNDTKEVTTSSTSSATSTTNVWIAAANYGGSILAPTNRQCAFATIGDGLTDTEASNLYNAVQRYQTQLGRQV